MNKFVVVVFSDQNKAYEGIRELQDLHREGSVTVYGTTVVERDASGAMVVKQRRDEGPVGMGVGALTGALIGLFAGPAGAAIGFMAGGVAGTLRDYLHGEVSDEFLEDIQRVLTPGKFAVIAEVSEDWLAPTDTRMEALGGTVIREGRQDFIDDLIEKRADARKAEFEQWKAERAGEVKEWKAERAAEVKQVKTDIASDKAERIESRLEAKLERAREKLQNVANKARERLDSTKAEMAAKLDALEAQVAKAEPEVRGRIEKRMVELRDEFAVREKKLAHAYELTQDALR